MIPLHVLYESGPAEPGAVAGVPSFVNSSFSLTFSNIHSTELLAGGGFWRAGGGGRGRGQSVPAVAHATPRHPPLEDAGVLPSHGEKVGVAVCEADVGDMAAVALVLVAWRLVGKKRAQKETHFIIDSFHKECNPAVIREGGKHLFYDFSPC